MWVENDCCKCGWKMIVASVGGKCVLQMWVENDCCKYGWKMCVANVGGKCVLQMWVENDCFFLIIAVNMFSYFFIFRRCYISIRSCVLVW